MRRLLFDCSVLLLAAWGLYYWKHRPEPVRQPAIAGVRPDLSMPAASDRPPAVDRQDAIQVTKGNIPQDYPRLKGKPSQPRALGSKPQLFDQAPMPPQEKGPAESVLDED